MSLDDEQPTTRKPHRTASPLTLFLVCVPLIFFAKTWIHDWRKSNREELGRRLQQSATWGNLAEVKSLIASGADINFKEDQTPIAQTSLKRALRNGRWDCADYLLAQGARTDLDDFCRPRGSLLGIVAGAPHSGQGSSESQLAWARLLIERGESVNDRDEFRETPLHPAARGGSTQLCELLIARGAEVDARDSRNTTPLMFAAEYGRVETVRLLLHHGADATLRGGLYQVTALHAAQHWRRTEVFSLLIEAEKLRKIH